MARERGQGVTSNQSDRCILHLTHPSSWRIFICPCPVAFWVRCGPRVRGRDRRRGRGRSHGGGRHRDHDRDQICRGRAAVLGARTELQRFPHRRIRPGRSRCRSRPVQGTGPSRGSLVRTFASRFSCATAFGVSPHLKTRCPGGRRAGNPALEGDKSAFCGGCLALS